MPLRRGLAVLDKILFPPAKLTLPDQFIPVAQRYGLMPELTRWVVAQACADNARLIARGLLDVPVAVNVGADAFYDDGFLAMLERSFQASGLPQQRLEIEITEDVAMSDLERATQRSRELHAAGIHLAMDDFGTGYSSLGRLKSLRFHKLKIDRSFVLELPGAAADHEIIRAIVSLARALGMRVVAEGIETHEQLAILREEGCDDGQGQWLAAPLPIAQLLELAAYPDYVSLPSPA
ncbi:TPA: EAL domain-containing protein [Pseudomonas aeruginosa]